jgi:hypothetical protein
MSLYAFHVQRLLFLSCRLGMEVPNWPTVRRETTFVIIILSVWFCLALVFGISGRFESVSAPFVAATVWVLTAVVLIACWKIRAINHWVRSVDLRWLISIHLVRFVGIYFLILCSRHELSCLFAKPAGIGDIIAATGAAVLLLTGRDGALRHPLPAADKPNRWLLLWNAFGLLDIVFVASAALRVGLNDWGSMAPLRSLPLSLLPTFIVPLIIASHILIFVRLFHTRGSKL